MSVTASSTFFSESHLHLQLVSLQGSSELGRGRDRDRFHHCSSHIYRLHKVAWDFKILVQMPEILTAQIHVKFPLPVSPLSASAKSRKMAIHGRELQSSRQSFDSTLKSNSCFPVPDVLGNTKPSSASYTAQEATKEATRLTAGRKISLCSHTILDNFKQS